METIQFRFELNNFIRIYFVAISTKVPNITW